MAQVTLSGKVQTVYEGRRFTNAQGVPTDAISFELCVSREGADERVSLLNGEQKSKCDFYRCHLYGKKAVDFYNLTLNNPKRIVTITGNMLQEDKPCYNRNIRFGKDNPLYPLLAQYAQASNGIIDLQPTGDIWVKGDYIQTKSVKINVHTFNFLDNPNAQNGQFGVESAPNNPFGSSQPFGGATQGNNGQFGSNTAGTFGVPATNAFGGAQPANAFGGAPTTNAFGGTPVANNGGFPATQPQSSTGGFQQTSTDAFQGSNPAGGFPSAGTTNGFAPANNAGFTPSNNGFEVANPQPQQTQVFEQAQGVAGFTGATQTPTGFASVGQTQQAPSTPVQQTVPAVETNIPAPQTAMGFTPAPEVTSTTTSGDNTRPF